MDNKINFYGFEIGVLLDKKDKEFDYYTCNNKELNYGFYNENNGFFLEKDYKENLKYIRDYVEQGVNGTYGVISFQGSVEIGGEDYKYIENNDCDLTNMDYSFFKNLSNIEYSVCKKDGKIIECFLEDEIKRSLVDKIKKDIPINELNLYYRAEIVLRKNGISTLHQLLETPLTDIKNLRNLGERQSLWSIQKELGRICHEVEYGRGFNSTEKGVEIEEEMDEIEK